MPFVAAHPETVGISINTLNEITSEDKSINLIFDDDKQYVESEFLSIPWFFQNFILLLTGIITVVIVSIVAITYREEISYQKSVKKIFSKTCSL